MPITQKISPFLWFDNQAEQAAKYYTSIFSNSRIITVTRYTEAGKDIHQRPAGSVMTVAFELEGQAFTALNGGPVFKFNESISFVISCETQEEIDYYWDKLGAGGDPGAQQCGWLKDKFGLSWQVVPKMLPELFVDANSPGAQRAMTAMMQMKKLDIAELQAAYAEAGVTTG
ncbi:MAG: VOC family protein [Betaproteobacteria bacterium]|nr:MAG: VOC family protein [Betaproteobacteria bacterium]